MHLTVISQFLMYPSTPPPKKKGWIRLMIVKSGCVLNVWALNKVCKTFINITICCHFTPGYFLFYFLNNFFFTLSHWTSILFARRNCLQFWMLFWVVWYFKCESLHFFRKPFFFFLVHFLFCRLFSIPQNTSLQGLQNMFTTKSQWSIYEFTL